MFNYGARVVIESNPLEALLILVGLVALLTPLIVVWLVFSHHKLRKVVRGLSEELAVLRAAPSTDNSSTAEKTAPARKTTTLQSYKVSSTDVAGLSETAGTAPSRASTPATPPHLRTVLDSPPKSFVFDTANLERLIAWVKENWFIGVAALSLAMAGIFLVQYGIESGILSPRNRVLSALAFGAGLIGFGEWIRRRTGDGPDGSAAFLPSTFAGAGIVTLFAAVLSAQQLYSLIGQETAFIGLVALAALSVVLGWLYGPFLTVIGLIGAVAAPFIVSTGTSENIIWLFYYFALIAAVGLGVDAMKRSAWVSSLGLIVPYIGATMIWLASESAHFIAFAAITAAAAVCIPAVQLRPTFNGAMTFHKLHFQGAAGWPEFPTRLAAGAIMALTGVAALVSMHGEVHFIVALAALPIALFVLAFWLNHTDVLDDLAVPIAAAILAAIGLQGFFGLSVADGYVNALADEFNEAPRTVTWLVGVGLAVSVITGLRSLRDTRHALHWAAGAAAFAPAVVILLALYWAPLTHLTDIQWASHVIGVAIIMTVLAEQSLRLAEPNRLQTSLFALAALNMIAFAMSVVLTETALTLGFAGIAASGAWLDRKFDIKPVSWFVQLVIAICGYRLLVDPGLPWALEASLWQISLGFLGTIGLLTIVWMLLQHRGRTGAIVVAESAIWSLGAVFVCLLIFRALDDAAAETHWAISLLGTVWLISAAAQLYRIQVAGVFRFVRLGLGAIFGIIGLLFVGIAVAAVSPLDVDIVVGPPLLDSLLVAYLLPAVVLVAVAWKFVHLHKGIRIASGAIGAALAALYAALEIRRLWQGPDITLPGVMDGELYSYTVAMLAVGSAVLGMALLKRSARLQKAGVAIIALTIAKVFLIDMSGLEGLIRVLSFLALGLVLAGLALLNRWITRALKEV